MTGISPQFRPQSRSNLRGYTAARAADQDKEKKQLLRELESMRLRVDRLKKSEIRGEQAEEALRESEEKFHILFENSPDGLILAKGGAFIDINREALRLLGCSKEQALNKHPWDFSPEKQPDGESSRGKAKRLIAMASQKGSLRCEWVHRRLDGSEFYSEVVATAIPMRGEQVLYVVLRNISDRKEKEEALKKRERELEENSRNLGKVNIALEVLLEQRGEDKKRPRITFYPGLRNLFSPTWRN